MSRSLKQHFFSSKVLSSTVCKIFAILGARHVQTRLVEPKTSSMNSGDVFVLVTPKYVHQWNGKNCSIMEKSRVSCYSRHLLVQGQQCKHQNNVWDLSKGDNKDPRTPSTLVCCFRGWLWTSKCRLKYSYNYSVCSAIADLVIKVFLCSF